MKKIMFAWILVLPWYLHAQLGIKGGLNFANVTNASSINSSSQTGFVVGGYLAPPSTGVMGFRTELLFSRQGYNYKTSVNTGNVDLDYILFPQLMCINLTKFVQIQFGAQMAILLNAKVDSSNESSAGATGNSSAMDAYNRFDYGYAIGGEIHPVSGLILGVRYNVSLGEMYKSENYSNPGAMPSFIPDINPKNNVVQLFVGWTFGKQPKKTKS
ncbi:MAG: porin family protein [Flavisolibacter sp.]